jgi:predicted nucleic acid-binding protein
MKLYFDVSCLNRPFDDLRQARVRLEAKAVERLVEQIDAGLHEQVSSEMAILEISAMSDLQRRGHVRALLPGPADIMELTPVIYGRAEVLQRLGFKPADAVHVSAAEAAGADVLLTCDDRLLRIGRRVKARLRVRIANPLDWLREHS